VELADAPLDATEFAQERRAGRLVLDGAVPQRPGEQFLPRRVVGDRVGATLRGELEAVLHRAQQPVGGLERRGVLLGDVAPVGERRERRQGAGVAQRWVDAAVHDLQELDAELDVAQPTRAELDLPGAVADDLGLALDAALHPLDLGHDPGVEFLGVDEDRRLVQQPLSEREVPGDRAGLQECLELPGLGPPFPVGDERLDGPGQGAVPALGAQGRVDLVDPPHRGRGVQDPQELLEDLPCLLRGGDLVAAGRLVHEHDVDVRHVVELAPAELAHPDHRDVAGRVVPGNQPVDGGQGTAQHPFRERGQLGRHLDHVDDAGEVASRDVGRRPTADRGHGRAPLLRRPAGRVEERLFDRGSGRLDGHGVEGAQRLHGVAVPRQEIAQRPGRAGHGDDPAEPVLGIAHGREHVGLIGAEAGQHLQGGDRIGRLRHRRQQITDGGRRIVRVARDQAGADELGQGLVGIQPGADQRAPPPLVGGAGRGHSVAR
jgi:hypothetical protein